MVQTAKYEHLLLFLSIIVIILFKVFLRKYHLIYSFHPKGFKSTATSIRNMTAYVASCKLYTVR